MPLLAQKDCDGAIMFLFEFIAEFYYFFSWHINQLGGAETID